MKPSAVFVPRGAFGCVVTHPAGFLAIPVRDWTILSASAEGLNLAVSDSKSASACTERPPREASCCLPAELASPLTAAAVRTDRKHRNCKIAQKTLAVHNAPTEGDIGRHNSWQCDCNSCTDASINCYREHRQLTNCGSRCLDRL